VPRYRSFPGRTAKMWQDSECSFLFYFVCPYNARLNFSVPNLGFVPALDGQTLLSTVRPRVDRRFTRPRIYDTCPQINTGRDKRTHPPSRSLSLVCVYVSIFIRNRNGIHIHPYTVTVHFHSPSPYPSILHCRSPLTYSIQ
jgi:hypothetical protein